MGRSPSACCTPDPRIPAFVERVSAEGERLYRDFPWRETRDPYAILVSEVMLQQTQVARVVPYFEEWLASFPTLEALAAAPLEAVLRAWQGLGYNRRAAALKRCAEQVVDAHGASGLSGMAELPKDAVALVALPGIGPATAAGVLAFGFGVPAAYLETNVRTVFLHELFAERDGVRDSELLPLVEQAARCAEATGVSARQWNYALLDYGSHLKRVVPNPSRRSAHHTRQSTFEGSRRQRRSQLLRVVIDTGPMSETQAAAAAGLSEAETHELLVALLSDGLVFNDEHGWHV